MEQKRMDLQQAHVWDMRNTAMQKIQNSLNVLNSTCIKSGFQVTSLSLTVFSQISLEKAAFPLYHVFQAAHLQNISIYLLGTL